MFNVRVSAEGLEGIAGRLGSRVGSAIGLNAMQAVNEVATRFEGTALGGMGANIGLAPGYIASKVRVEPATDLLNPRAEVVAVGDLTIMGRFPLTQLTQPAARARGDASRGIPAGRKQAGVRVAIRRTAPTQQERWFTMRLRSGVGTGVFVRDGERVKHLYGPSPYSLFRYQINTRLADVEADLERTVAQKIADGVERAL